MSGGSTWNDPVAAFEELAGRHERMFWLDGGGSRAWSGRRSLLGWLEDDDVSLTFDAAAKQVWRHAGGRSEVVGDDVFAVLEEELARDAGDPSVSWVGYFGYAARPDLPAAPDPLAPDAVWMRAPRHVVFTHPGAGADPPAEGVVGPAGVPPGAGPAGHGPASTGGPTRAEYAGLFDRVQEQLRLGNSYEVNLTYREQLVSGVDPVTGYLRLRAASPAPYAGFVRHGDLRVLSASPERYATVDRRRVLQAKPIKGTTPRGPDEREDARHREALATDPRYRAENLMIVDLLRNDLSMVCEPGTVRVPELMQVESYAHVHQLVSTVRGRLREGVSTLAALRALFPAGSMTGAPKLRTMEIIDAVETSPRGVYAGALGWISPDGRADLGVVIRTLVARPEPGAPGQWRYTAGTGGGITVRSEVDSEYDETRWKVARLLAAVADEG